MILSELIVFKSISQRNVAGNEMIMNIVGHPHLARLISLFLFFSHISGSHAAGVISTAMISVLVEV